MKKYLVPTLLIITILGALVVLYYLTSERDNIPGKYDVFAACLAGKNATMYGADWCPHCQTEKKAFGSSFRFVPYVECPDEPKICVEKGIEGYPTWIMGDGRRLEGVQGLEKLSAESGCPLP
ncbi:MAG TPA: hypothetical protein VNK70_02920 [Candidatus Paceibacterota bacterium]|nr:hypothetical protein [Candidatus Paceibacterota bacterium]